MADYSAGGPGLARGDMAGLGRGNRAPTDPGHAEQGGDVMAQAVAAGPLGAWALMSVAMMTPVTLRAVRHTARHSFPWRRLRAMTAYMAAYLGFWLALGPPALALVALARVAGAREGLLVAALLAVSALWQATPWKRRAVRGCRWTRSLPPLGRRADVACLRFGLQQAVGCLVACWPLMLVMVAVGHDGWAAVGVMAIITALLVAEERTHLRRPRASVATAAMALVAGVVALAG